MVTVNEDTSVEDEISFYANKTDNELPKINLSSWIVELEKNNAYYVKTHHNKYAKVVISDIYEDSVNIKYLLQLNRSKNFSIPLVDYSISNS